MNLQLKTTLAAVSLLALVVGSAHATTIGFVGAAGVNQDIPANYGSNISGGGTGWTTTDGTGATPNVTLDWGNSTAWAWEFHSATTFQYIEALHAGGSWDAVSPPTTNAVAQLQDAQPNGKLELNFSVIPGVQLVLNSFDIGNATDQQAADGPYGFDIALIRDSDTTTVWSHSTPLWDVGTSGREESVAVGYTGAPGESYTLAFTRTGSGNGSTFRSGLDNLSFSEILNPGAPQFKLTVDRSTGGLSLTNTGTTATSIKGYSITSESGALNHSGWKTIDGNYDLSGNGSVDSNDDWTKLSNPSDRTDFSEFEFGGDGGSIGSGASVVLNQPAGNAWQKTPSQFEDLTLDIALTDGKFYRYPVEYINGPVGGYPIGDLNFDGVVDPLDWPAYNAGRGVDMTGLTAVEAYLLGDLDGDYDNDIADFVLFKQLASPLVGAESSAESIPEPLAISLLLTACAALCFRRPAKGRIHCETTSRRSIPVKTFCAIPLGVCVLYATAIGSAQATTIGFVGAASVNADLPVGYGSNIASDGTGWTVSDGTGATPNIALYWGGSPDSTGWDWEFHNAVTFQYLEGLNAGGTWDALSPPSSNGVAQLQHQSGAPHEINFSVSGGTTFTLNSFDIGNATDQTASEGPYGFDIQLIRDSDTATVWSHSTPLWDIGTSGREESVFVGYTGSPGQSYTLRFTRTGSGSGVTWRSGLDNLSFSEGAIVDPLKLVVSMTTGVVELKNQSGQSYTIDSYEITSASDSLDPAGWQSLEDSDYEGNGAPVSGNGWEEAGGVDAGQLIESYLLGSTAITNGTSIFLGQAFDYDKVGVMQDLQFGYHVDGQGGVLNIGNVEYISPVLDSDFDNDTDFDGLDFLTWQRGFGLTGSATNALGDADGDFDVDMSDLVAWEIQYGDAPPLVGATTAVPEPSTVSLFLMAGVGWLAGGRRSRRTLHVAAQVPSHTTWIAGLVSTFCLLLVVQPAMATKTNDRRYEFGDGGTSNTQDSEYLPAQDDKQDLSVPAGSGSPAFVNVSSTGLNRPGAATGDKGAQFDGVDDVLQSYDAINGLPTPLNRPDETAGPDLVGIGPLIFPFPYNYNGITARGLQMWVYPDASAIGTGRQGVVFDTQAAGGVSITADGKWTQSFAGVVTDGLIGATVPVVGNQWHHVMHHIYRSTQPGFPDPLSNGRSYTGVVYVNGVAVSASNGTVSAGQLDDGNRVGVLAVGAEEISNDGFTPLFDNHFKGVVDDLQMYVYGDNSSDPGFPAGQDYGTFDLFSDNKWIADQIALIPGGVLKSGDLNLDGNVNSSDISDFVLGWNKEKKLKGAVNEMYVGDWETWGWGDINTDGQVDLYDAFLLNDALIFAGEGPLNFDLLTGTVPEPTSLGLGLLGWATLSLRHRRRG